MHHQNVSLQNAPSKRTFLTFKAGVVLLLTSLMRSKEYVLMVHFAMIRFDGASGACQLEIRGNCGNDLEFSSTPLFSPFLGGLEIHNLWTDHFVDISISPSIHQSTLKGIGWKNLGEGTCFHRGDWHPPACPKDHSKVFRSRVLERSIFIFQR